MLSRRSVSTTVDEEEYDVISERPMGTTADYRGV